MDVCFWAVFTTWLQAQSPAARAGVETVAMDGLTGSKSAAAEGLPNAAVVMDPFYVVALAGDDLDRTRQRLQQEPTVTVVAPGIRSTGSGPSRAPGLPYSPTDNTSLLPQCSPTRATCAAAPATYWPTLTVPAGRTGQRRPINGRLEHLRGTALGFPSLTNYLARPFLIGRRLQNPTTPSSAMSHRTCMGH